MSGSAIPVDVANLIDARPISALQIRVFVLCGLVAVLDGIDSQSIGVAAPLIARDLGLSPAAFAPVFSSGLMGAAIGAMVFGPLADRMGRKPMLIFATALFGVFTCATALATSFPILLGYRFIAGLGLGGAIPCFIALGAEYAPARRRAMITSLLWAGYPLGLSIGGFMSSYVISNFDWPAVFFAGGAPAVGTSLLLLFLLPESLRFLTSHKRADTQAERIARQLDPSLLGTRLKLTMSGESGGQTANLSTIELFKDGRAAGTILLGLILLLAFAATTVIVLQVPTLLQAAGVPLATSAQLVGVYSLVAVFGMAVAGRVVEKVGPVAALAPAYVCGGLLFAALGYLAPSPVAAGLIMALLGATIPLGVAGSIALTAIFYPTAMRSAGTGWAMGLGRFGQFLSPLAVGLMLYLGWPIAGIFVAMGIAPIFAGLCVVLHVALSRLKVVASQRLTADEYGS